MSGWVGGGGGEGRVAGDCLRPETVCSRARGRELARRLGHKHTGSEVYNIIAAM